MICSIIYFFICTYLLTGPSSDTNFTSVSATPPNLQACPIKIWRIDWLLYSFYFFVSLQSKYAYTSSALLLMMFPIILLKQFTHTSDNCSEDLLIYYNRHSKFEYFCLNFYSADSVSPSIYYYISDSFLILRDLRIDFLSSSPWMKSLYASP